MTDKTEYENETLMQLIHEFLNFILHLDTHLVNFVTFYGAWTYAILFLVIFCETGLVVTPFLPGDSLLFAAGALSAHTHNGFNIHVLFISLFAASFFGNALNYAIGKFIGPKVFYSENSRFLNRKYLDRAHAFYEKYGGKTIIIARFIPIIRTFAPFLAGIGYMQPGQFFFYNILGAALWIGGLLYISYGFGNLPFIHNHFSTIIIGIIIISLIPAGVEILRQSAKSLNNEEM